jgi:hypothetical protein
MEGIKNLLIVLLAASAIIIGMGGFYASLANKYNVPYQEMSYISRANETVENIKDVESSINQGFKTEGITLTDNPLTGLILGGWNTLKLLWGSTSIVQGMIIDIASIPALMMPSWVTGIVVAAIAVIFIFAILGVILR